jgi:hypothetical protein
LVGNIMMSGQRNVILFQPNQGDKQVIDCLADLGKTFKPLDTSRRIRFVEWKDVTDVNLCPYRGRLRFLFV